MFKYYPASDFLSLINFDQIHKHGAFIYFVYIFLFDSHYNIIRISKPFIPTTNQSHLPYVLAYPAGIAADPVTNNIIISYGEGDCKCKLLILKSDIVDDLLTDTCNYGFYFLTLDIKIRHFGYFGHKNTGDDAFTHVFKYLHSKFNPFATIVYENYFADSDTDIHIIGGGDIINPYFMEQIVTTKPVIAAGVGIPYLANVRYLPKCSEVIMRNKVDATELNYVYYPDLAFLLPKILPVMPVVPVVHAKLNSTIKQIGFCLTRTYYNPRYVNLYDAYVDSIVVCINKLLTNNYDINLIPFCFDPRNSSEYDILLLTDIKAHFATNSNVHICLQDHDITRSEYVADVYNIINQMDFIVCTRFHSHIFATIATVPFVSLTCGRKCLTYMNDIGLNSLVYKLTTNEIDLPIDFSGTHFYDFLLNHITNATNIKSQLVQIRQQQEKLMVQFEAYWAKLMSTYTQTSRKIKLCPESHNDIGITYPPIIAYGPNPPCCCSPCIFADLQTDKSVEIPPLDSLLKKLKI